MELKFSQHFDKDMKMLSSADRILVRDALFLFRTEPFNVHLNNHQLRDNLHGRRSINISHDLRAHYIPGKNKATFVRVGRHQDLYL